MVRRPIFLLVILLLGAALVQAAVVAVTEPQQKTTGGEICTVCGPLPHHAPFDEKDIRPTTENTEITE